MRSRSAIADCEDCLSRIWSPRGRHEVPGGNVEAVMRMHEGEFRSKGDEAVPTASRQSEPTATSSPQPLLIGVFKALSA